jgi:hypothetical protein
MRRPAGQSRLRVSRCPRMLVKSPGFTAVAVLSFGIGIGMCSAVTSECRSIAVPPPGMRNPAALVTPDPISYPYYERYRDQHQVLESAAVYIGLAPFAVVFTPDKKARRRSDSMDTWCRWTSSLRWE